ncbi:GxxExxY protein [Flavobacterium araucananum]|uniref:GxxExxY protein n=1 Tax=Flavobacterium araucananum TaxID=946678 RepID=A0A227PCZ4_9FLAO|nr:GxxExxY protein [Flavobacterium araucananum]OXG07770.1 GxxExxY protein [Flavobacterium araucananum]
MLSERTEEIGKIIVHSAFKVHKQLGPGLLERVYEVCLAYEIEKAGLNVKRQVDIPIVYDGIEFNEGLRLDLLIEDSIIIEIKAVEQINPVWEAQIISHLRLLNKDLGYLINFNVPLIKSGIKRFIHTKKSILENQIKAFKANKK